MCRSLRKGVRNTRFVSDATADNGDRLGPNGIWGARSSPAGEPLPWADILPHPPGEHVLSPANPGAYPAPGVLPQRSSQAGRVGRQWKGSRWVSPQPLRAAAEAGELTADAVEPPAAGTPAGGSPLVEGFLCAAVHAGEAAEAATPPDEGSTAGLPPAVEELLRAAVQAGEAAEAASHPAVSTAAASSPSVKQLPTRLRAAATARQGADPNPAGLPAPRWARKGLQRRAQAGGTADATPVIANVAALARVSERARVAPADANPSPSPKPSASGALTARGQRTGLERHSGGLDEPAGLGPGSQTEQMGPTPQGQPRARGPRGGQGPGLPTQYGPGRPRAAEDPDFDWDGEPKRRPFQQGPRRGAGLGGGGEGAEQGRGKARQGTPEARPAEPALLRRGTSSTATFFTKVGSHDPEIT